MIARYLGYDCNTVYGRSYGHILLAFLLSEGPVLMIADETCLPLQVMWRWSSLGCCSKVLERYEARKSLKLWLDFE